MKELLTEMGAAKAKLLLDSQPNLSNHHRRKNKLHHRHQKFDPPSFILLLTLRLYEKEEKIH